MLVKSTKKLAKEFNALFHGETLLQLPILAGLGREVEIANEWHFDIRYIALPELAGHNLVLSQRHSDIIYLQRLPLEAQDPDIDDEEGEIGTLFFPESGTEAAPETVRAIMNAFINYPGDEDFMPRRFSPYKLTTTDEDLAVAVGEELKRLGAHAGLHNISCRPSSKKTHDRFNRQFEKMKGYHGFSELQSSLFHTPSPLNFRDLRITDYLEDHEVQRSAPISSSERALFLQCMRFVQEWTMAETIPESVTSQTMMKQVLEARSIMEERPTPAIKAQADRVCMVAALDYGIRSRTGFGCKRNRTEAYNYLVLVTLSPLSDDYRKATAHSALVHWHTNAQEGRLDRRHLLSACYHANAATRFFRRLEKQQPVDSGQERLPASPRVLRFMETTYKQYIDEYPEMVLLAQDARWAKEGRDRQLVKAGRSILPQRRFEFPPRYICAAVGCNVKVKTGKLLHACSGKCDRSMKPRYCSKTCQRADWKNHKPFCIPGAECSVIDNTPV